MLIKTVRFIGCQAVSVPAAPAEKGSEKHANNEGDAKNDQKEI